MKKLLVITIALFVGIQFSWAQDKKKKKKSGPEMKFKKEVHKFGKIQVGTKAKHEFTFKNVGNEPLIIQNVKASCGCTTPNWPKEPILPGKSGKIKAVYNSKGRPGSFHKAITIRSNAKKPSKVLYIKGKAVKNLKKETSPERQDKSMIKKNNN